MFCVLRFGNVAIPRCEHPGFLANGQVDVRKGTAVGESVYYRCDVGFILKGDSIRTCQKDYTWSGTAPVCTGICMLYIHADIVIVIMACLHWMLIHMTLICRCVR